MDTISILLADDHPLFLLGLREAIEKLNNLHPIYEAKDGESAMRIIEERKPTLAILDIEMPKMDGLEIAKVVQQRNFPCDIIILTMYNKENMFNNAMDAGVMGYVLKENAVREILHCITTVLEGKHFVSPVLSEFLLRRNKRSIIGTIKSDGIQSLTEMERKVLSFVAEMKTTDEIADELFISSRTVETHRHNICSKLNIHGANALLKFVLNNKPFL
jgi:DNA-binding NarL/FixJ family response regulator